MKIASQALGITAWQGKVTIGKNSEPNLRMFFHLKGFVSNTDFGPTATKFPPIPDRVLYTLRFVQAGFDCHIVPYNAQAATAIRHKAKEAGRSLGEQCAAAGLQHHPFRDGLAQVLARELADAQQRAMRLRGGGSGAAGQR